LTLLVAAGLMLRSYRRLLDAPAGFDTENVLTLEMSLPSRAYDTRDGRVNFFRAAVARARGSSGVEVAAAAQSLPLRGPGLTDPVVVEGRAEPARGAIPFVRQNIVTPDYFRAMGMRIARGRAFDERETWEAGGAIMINETFARRFFAGEDPLGKRIKLGVEKPWMTVVGIVGDTLEDGFDCEPIAQMFYPYTNPSDELPLAFLTLALRTSNDPASLAASARAEVRRMDPNVPVSRVQTMRAIAEHSNAGARFNLMLTTLFAALALALASSMLFGVSANDPPTFAAVALLLSCVALAACLLPARRAARIDPLAALRDE
jgi:hypothetical protein